MQFPNTNFKYLNLVNYYNFLWSNTLWTKILECMIYILIGIDNTLFLYVAYKSEKRLLLYSLYQNP